MNHTFFLIYRVANEQTQPIRWDKPDGGLVLKPKKICNGVCIADFGLAEEIASHRYHRAPWEQLLLVEVMEEHDQHRARRLHNKYQRDFSSFIELMEAG